MNSVIYQDLPFNKKSPYLQISGFGCLSKIEPNSAKIVACIGIYRPNMPAKNAVLQAMHQNPAGSATMPLFVTPSGS